MLDTIQNRLDNALEDDAASGNFRVGRDIFTDPAIFELEMKHIFEGNWIYLAHESLRERLQPPRRDAVPPQAWQ